MNFLETKGIIPRVMGGLGNQIFITLAAYIVHKVKGCPLYIFKNAVSNNAHNINKFDYNDSIFKYFGIHIEHILDDTLLRFLVQNGYSFHNMHHLDGFKKWNPETINTGTITSSYYQYYPTLQPYENEIRELLLKGLNEHSNLSHIDKKEAVAFLHIRRGDYLKCQDIHFIQPLDYYINAINTLLKQKQIEKIHVISDDIAWVKSIDFFQSQLFNIIESKDELYTLHLMSQCKGGAICANSTFSWWGAFLGAYANRAPVIIPKKWISLEIEALFPDEWIVI